MQGTEVQSIREGMIRFGGAVIEEFTEQLCISGGPANSWGQSPNSKWIKQ